MRIAVCALVLATACAVNADPADMVLRNGVIHTEDAARSVVQAVAIKDGLFVYVGDDAGVAQHAGASTKVTDLEGRMVLPGFIDSHMHPSGVAASAGGVKVEGENVDEYVACVKRYRDAHPELTILNGTGWLNTKVPLTGPTSVALDKAVSDIPAVIQSEDGHSIWLNSLAMEKVGFADLKKDPQGGRIERDPKTKKPLGTVREWGAELPVMQMFGKRATEELLKPLKDVFSKLNALGITTVHDAGIFQGAATDALEQLAQNGELTMRVRGAFFVLPSHDKDVEGMVVKCLEEQAKHTNDLFKVNAVKLFMDGVIEGRTALLEKPYLVGKPSQKGLQMWPQDHLKKFVLAAHMAGFQAHFHAVGDRAVRLALDALQYAANHGGGLDHRDLITHLQLVRAADFKRFAKMNVIAVPQPQWHIVDEYYNKLQEPYLGVTRAAHEYPMKSFVDAGVPLASSTDFPASPDPDPMLGIQGGVLRWLPESGDNPPLWPSERVDLARMLDSYTIGGAYANFLEDETGAIEVGKSADLVVLSDDLTKIAPETIYKTKALMTLLRGKIVWQASQEKTKQE